MKECTVNAVIDSIETVTAFVDEILEENDCPIKVQMQIDIVIDELFSNIANYAYGEASGTATVCAGYDGEKGEFVLIFIDSGVPYDPIKAEEPDITLSAEDRKIGGLGIFLVKKTMDDIRYRYEDGKNILTVTKKF